MLIALCLVIAFVLIQIANWLRQTTRVKTWESAEFKMNLWTLSVFFDVAALALVFYAGMLAGGGA